MSKSQTPRIADAVRAFRLLGELRELGADPVAWRTHLLEGLTALLGAQVGLTGEMELPYTLNHMRPANPIDFGWRGASERQAWRDYFSRLDISDDPTWHTLYPHAGRPLTKFRDQFMPPSQWYRCEHVQRYRRVSGVDSFIISQRPLPWLKRDHLIYILRGWEEKPMQVRQARILKMFHDEFVIMLQRDALKAHTDSRLNGLSPRLRQTLGLLLAGHTEKAIAVQLALSRHTIHQYVAMLYRRLQVCSRAELMAMPKRPEPRGALVLDIPGFPRVPAANAPIITKPMNNF